MATRRPPTILHSPVLNAQALPQEQLLHKPIYNSALSKAKSEQSTSSVVLSPPPADEKGPANTRHAMGLRPISADLLPLSDMPEKRPSDRPSRIPTATSSRGHSGSQRSPAPVHYPPQSREPCEDPGCLGCGWFSNLSPRARLWLSFGAWGATSIGFILAIAFWKKEVFTGLDNLSHWLAAEGFKGYAIIFFLIFVTTIPPLPLYSTFMMLSGYTFGTWQGFFISYSASLIGATVVFAFSRHFFATSLVKVLAHTPGLARAVRAVSKNPKLLFLVRLAPYPYNVMNVLLAACPSLTMRRFIGCTGLSLLKTVIHTSIGAGIHSFTGYYGVLPEDGTHPEHSDSRSDLARWSTGIGIVLCILLLIYLSYLARRAVDGELEGEESGETRSTVLPTHHRGRDRVRSTRHSRLPSTPQERMAFLSPIGDPESDSERENVEMGENSPSRVLVRGSSPVR